jgi:hypothetical protein
VIAWDYNPELRRTEFRLRGRSQVCDHGSHDVGRDGLRSRITIGLHTDRDYPDNGDETKGCNTQRQRYFNQ